MKHRIVPILKILAAIMVFGLLLSIGFVVFTIIDAPLDRLEKIQPNVSKIFSEEGAIELEEGSLVNLKEIQSYLLFSKSEKSFQSWLKDNSEKVLKLKNSMASIQRKVMVSNLAENDCSLIYCYQRRIPFESIPSVFWKGLIGIEDHRYLDHSGVDPKSIIRALVTDIIERNFKQGGSTLTQQLIKNLLYTNEKRISRKLKEMIVSIYVEQKYSKENILEAYLNEVMWGSLQGIKIKGIYAASVFYFGKKPKEINAFEASILIGLLKGPSYYNPIYKLERLKSRAKVVHNKLKSLNFIEEEDSTHWSDSHWASWKNQLIKKNELKHNYAVWRALKNESSYIDDYGKFVFFVKSLKVLKDINKRYPEKDISIKAILGPISGADKFSYYSKYERKKDVAIENEKHQVGSTLKPIIYSILGENGLKFSDEVSTLPILLDLKSGKWSPKEAHKNLPETVTITDALLHSYNRPIIRISSELGFEKVEEGLLKYIPELKKPLSEYPAQLLGAVELSMGEIFNVYKKFILKECERAPEDYDNNVLMILSDPSKTTVRKIVSSQMKKMRFFGKTGTSNSGFDNWFISFDGSMLSVVWVGYEGIRGKTKLNLYGGSTAFRIFQNFARDRGRRFNELSCSFEK